MSVDILKLKYLGKMCKFFRVIDADGEVLHVACSQQEAEEWIAAKSA